MKRSAAVVWLALAAVPVACSRTPPAGLEAIEHFGMCEASAAVAAGPTMFVVANDEDNVLRVYRNDAPGGPVHTFDLTPFLTPDPDHPEADIEGATRVGDRAYWIASHGTSKEGRPRPGRRRLFATDLSVTGDAVAITPVGTPYEDLVQDLARADHLRGLRLGDAAGRPPEGAGGLNIEGLCATPGGALLIAFRSPVPGGDALLVPLETPHEVVGGKAAKFGAPVGLSLGGRGIRGIEYSDAKGKYLIVAGPRGDRGGFQLYQWSGSASDEPDPLAGIDFKGWHPEALVVYPGGAKVQVLSDDGERRVGGKACQDAAPAQRRFRSAWVSP